MGRPKGKSPARGGGRTKGQRRLDDYATPRRSARIRSSDLKIEGTTKIEELAAGLLLEHRDVDTITLQKSSEKKAKSNKGKKQDVAPQKKVLVEKPGLELKLKEDDQRELLKDFDLNHVYGPCRGITRRERFLRAHRYNVKPLPDDIIVQILEQHEDDFTFQKCIWDQKLHA